CAGFHRVETRGRGKGSGHGLRRQRFDLGWIESAITIANQRSERLIELRDHAADPVSHACFDDTAAWRGDRSTVVSPQDMRRDPGTNCRRDRWPVLKKCMVHLRTEL